ncbi:hypothetical protein HETIRDRAFT_384845 [Heterobasidion irregulare TC 32-1]|uniref:BTB domain-containing protein n=1 Tax=Heterobasidion irregulare (strain TC 32-1) TaxID=747525 RepID=W4K4P3_HETIT|nr:uncharacterized protein HETIRDRAFT_384845 [Heterobasidion irregulare TC 32-1]ETW80320.1 hypothetical protein HETIRDRAFT_384845 [Heterobasidion irregulare TC 32-1]
MTDNIERRAGILKDESYYMEYLVILAGKTLFKVPRWGLEANDIFSMMYTLPNGTAGAEGSSDENPIQLSGEISAEEFRSFLKVLYPMTGSSKAGVDWQAVLKLSTLWDFGKVRQRAIAELEKKSREPLESILLARKHQVFKWLIEGYVELARRPEPLTFEEGEQLGWPVFARLVDLRERSWQSAGGKTCVAEKVRLEFDFASEVQKLFGNEITENGA